MEAIAAAAMVDLNTLSRRELQALCKLNGVRANMTNLAMVEALHSLPSVDGIDQVGTTLCLPTPGKSAVKSALRTAAPSSDQQQQGSPLPRGRRVSVKSPEAIRTENAEDDDDYDTKRSLVREIVRTPGVALRSAGRRPRATPAPLPTPAAGALRRSQRSTARKAAAPAEEVEVSAAKRSTRRTARPVAMIDFDQDEEDAAVAPREPKAATSDEKCDDREDGRQRKAEEGAAAIGDEQKLVSAEKSAPLSAMEGSPILGVLSKEAPEPAVNNVENASEDREVIGSLSPVLEIANKINDASEDKEDVAVDVPEETVKEDASNSTVEAAAVPSKIIAAVMTEKDIAVDESPEEYVLAGESREEADLTEESNEMDKLDGKEEHMLNADRTVDEESFETIGSAIAPAVIEKEVAVNDLPLAELTDNEGADENDLGEESSEEADLTEESSEVDEEDIVKYDQTVDEESDDTIEVSGSIDVNYDLDEEEEQVEMLETGEEKKEVEESDSLTGEDDDFSGDLSSEFDDVLNFSDAETDRDSSPVALEGINVAVAATSAAKTVESVITEEMEVSNEGDVVTQDVEPIAEPLDKVTITEEKKEECTKEKNQLKVGKEMSLRKLKSAYKESLIAAKEWKKLTIASDEGSRVALAELDDNADC